MRHNLLWTLTALALGLAVAASAEARPCSNRSLAGAWGYTETGMVRVPYEDVVAAAVGKYDFDANGNVAGMQFSSAAGTVSKDFKLGTYVLNADCTGTLTLQIFDSTGTTLLRNSVWSIVLDDEVTELRGIMVSMVTAGGVALEPAMTLNAKRVSSRQSAEK